MENFRRYQQQCATLFEKRDEQNRRYVAGLIALTLGYGGVCFVAGLDRDTVSRGKHELIDNLFDCPSGRRFLDKKVRKSFRSILEANRSARENSPD